jgi:hypothetical protein
LYEDTWGECINIDYDRCGIPMKTHHGFSISMSVYRRVQWGMGIETSRYQTIENELTDRNGRQLGASGE